jgi:hypothetical protein
LKLTGTLKPSRQRADLRSAFIGETRTANLTSNAPFDIDESLPVAHENYPSGSLDRI